MSGIAKGNHDVEPFCQCTNASSASEYPVTRSILLEEREMCLAAFSVDNVLSIFAIGGIMPNSSTCDAPVVRPGVVCASDALITHMHMSHGMRQPFHSPLQPPGRPKEAPGCVSCRLPLQRCIFQPSIQSRSPSQSQNRIEYEPQFRHAGMAGCCSALLSEPSGS